MTGAEPHERRTPPTPRSQAPHRRRSWRAAIITTGLALIAVIVVQTVATAVTPPHASHRLRVTNTTLVMHSQTAALAFDGGSPGDQFRWTLSGPSVSRTAVMTFASGPATVPLAGTAPGYYTFGVEYGLGSGIVKQEVGIAITADTAATGPIGVTIHPNEYRTAVLQSRLAELKALGVRYVRTDAPWSSIELTRGVYTFPAKFEADLRSMMAAGMKVLLIPDYLNPLYDAGRTPSSAAGIAAYAQFAAAVATHYPQAEIEMYNEFNGVFNSGRCGTTARCYLQLATVTRSAIRAASPATVVVGPGAAGGGTSQSWLRSFAQAKGLQQVDALTFHPYLGTRAPEQLETALKNVAMFAPGAPIWLTEFGYSTARGQVSQAKQAQFLLRSAALAFSQGVDRLYWYDAFDDGVSGTDKESNFGLFSHPTALAPGAWVPKAAASTVAWVDQNVSATTAMQAMPAAAGTYVVRYRPSAGTGYGYIAWAPRPRQVRLAPTSYSASQQRTVHATAVGPDPVIVRSSATRIGAVAAG